MSRSRLIAVAVAVALGVIMLLLLFRGPRVVFANDDGPDVHVECAAVATVGWPSDHAYLAGDQITFWSDHVVTQGVELGEQARPDIARECGDRRDTYLAFLVVLAIPTSVLTAFASLRREPRPVVPPMVPAKD